MPATQGNARWPALLSSLLTLTTLLLTGCYDTKQEITLNPDGTGKIEIESVFLQIDPFLIKEAERAALKNVTNLVKSLIDQSEGVEAWRDVAFRQREDGKGYFRGTAYFQSLSRLKLAVVGDQQFSVSPDGAGNLTITLRLPPETDKLMKKPDEPVTAESIQRERAGFRNLLPMLNIIVGESRRDTTIRLPGPLLRSSIFETNTPGTLRLLQDGRKTLAAMETIMFNTNLDARRIAGEKFGPDSDEMMKLVYGHPGPLIAVVKPGKVPLFDFESEVAKARLDFAKTVEMFALPEPPPPPKPAPAGSRALARITGVDWNFEKEHPNVYPRHDVASYALTIKAELPGAVFKANRVEVLNAITVEGTRLSAQSLSWNETPRLWPGSTNVSFTIRLTPPPIDSKGIAELSGVLECECPENTRTVDLVVGKIRGGVNGTEFNTQVDDVYPNWSGGDKLTLRTSLKPEEFRSLKVIGENGQVVALQSRSHSLAGNEHIYTYGSRTEFARSGKLVAEVLTGIQTVRIPFTLTNVTLLGQPLSR